MRWPFSGVSGLFRKKAEPDVSPEEISSEPVERTHIITGYSQRLSPPFSGQVQIAESDRARALSPDGENWEFQFLTVSNNQAGRSSQEPKKGYKRAAFIKRSELAAIAKRPPSENAAIDERILELTHFLVEAELPFPATDSYEYWLLDAEDESPLALIFSCSEPESMDRFPSLPEWTSLSAAVMPIEATDEEKECGEPPVNYRLERLVAERAGSKPRARWFDRSADQSEKFPAFLLREDWPDEAHQDLAHRYIQRQSSRLLMLHGLNDEDRRRMEVAARAHPFEVEKFFPLYPEVGDQKVMSAIRVEARLRKNGKDEIHKSNR